MTRRSFLAWFSVPMAARSLRELADSDPAGQVRTLTRELASVEEVARPEGFILRGILKPAATDGSPSFAIGDHYFGFHPDCALKASTDALLDQRVVWEVRRDR